MPKFGRLKGWSRVWSDIYLQLRNKEQRGGAAPVTGPFTITPDFDADSGIIGYQHIGDDFFGSSTGDEPFTGCTIEQLLFFSTSDPTALNIVIDGDATAFFVAGSITIADYTLTQDDIDGGSISYDSGSGKTTAAFTPSPVTLVAATPFTVVYTP